MTTLISHLTYSITPQLAQAFFRVVADYYGTFY